MEEKNLACKLTGPEFQKYKTEVLAALRNNMRAEELDNGYKYIFNGSDDMIDTIISFIKKERICCNFFTFNLLIEDNNSDVILTITGPKGAKEFINDEISL